MSPITARRFIPACAGNRSVTAWVRGHPEVHPRVCGEQHLAILAIRAADGSSPRVRGTAHCSEESLDEGRFIPACAGNRSRRETAIRRSTVHPRVCGEQITIGLIGALAYGSSPRVRGTVSVALSESLTEKYSIYYQLLVSLHGCSQRAPRLSAQGIVDSPLCDFHSVKKRNNLILNINILFSQALRLPSLGSSPRVRGTVDLLGNMQAMLRFIPACAGNRTYGLKSSLHTSVHPRVCGEQRCRVIGLLLGTGSSPRVRGTV